jgi:hypothetical protein
MRLSRPLIALVSAAALAVAVFAGLGPGAGVASSHREAPLVAADPQIDTTDVYAFVSPDKQNTVTLIANWIPFEEPAGGPNFYAFSPDARYDVNVDNDGDAVADIVYRWRFANHYRSPETFLYNTGLVTSLTDPDLNFFQTYDLFRIKGGTSTRLLDDALVAPSRVGDFSMPDYEGLRDEAIYTMGSDGSRAFAGQADDSFYLDLRVFDLVYGAPTFSEVGTDTLAGFSVNSVALRVPKGQVAAGGDGSGIVGVWSSVQRRSVRVQDSEGGQSYTGSFVQVSRLGMPLVNEVVIPVGQKDRFNASQPIDDGQFLDFVLEPELPEDVQALYGLAAPDTCGDPNTPPRCRDDLVQVFLTGIPGLNQPPTVTPSEMIRLNMSVPVCEPGVCATYSPLGVIGGDTAGYPNGRRLADDVIDISLQVVEGELVGNPNDLSDGVDVNDVSFSSTFPYLALPQSGSAPAPHTYAAKPLP